MSENEVTVKIADEIKFAEKASLSKTITFDISIQGKDTEFVCHIEPPGAKLELETLEKALKRNRDMLDKSHKDMVENLKKDWFDRLPPWMLNYPGPAKNALIARLNIEHLIPMINARGGEAEFTKLESMPVKSHIEKLMKKAEKAALEYQIKKAAPFNYAFALSMLIAAVVFAYAKLK